MDSLIKAIYQSWEWRPEIIIVLSVAGGAYILGWYRLRTRLSFWRSRERLATFWRLIAYLSGLVIVGAALMSPIDVLGGQLLSMHMLQHLLLMMIAPPLLMLTNPFPFLLWGLPLWARRGVVLLLNGRANFRQRICRMTNPIIVLSLFIACLWGWHVPSAYDAALRSNLVHDLEHLTFFVTAMLFWWHVTAAGPRIHKRFPFGVRIGYLAAAIPPNMLTGVAIAFANEPIYTYYTTVPRLFGLTVMQDQMIGGVIMWVPGSMMYIIAILILVSRRLQMENEKPPLLVEDPRSEVEDPRSEGRRSDVCPPGYRAYRADAWATDEVMVAPGWDKK